MAIARRGNPEQLLQQPMDRRGGKKIASAHNIRDMLERIIHCHCEMVAGRPVTAKQHYVAPERRFGPALRRSGSFAVFGPFEVGWNSRKHAPYIETPDHRLPPSDPSCAFLDRERPASPGINRRSVRVAPPGCLCDVRSAAKTGIYKSCGCNALERRDVICGVLALPPRRSPKTKAEPEEIFLNRRFILRPASAPIQILEAQQQAPVQRLGNTLVHQRAIGVAEMQEAVRRWRESQGGDAGRVVGAHGAKVHT